MDKPIALLAPRAAQGRRRAGGFGRRCRSALDTLLGIGEAFAQGAEAAADARPALVLYRGQCRRHASPPSSARWTWARACSSPSARSSPKSSTCRSTVKVIMGDTATSVNQGGASGSTGIQLGGKQLRIAAAEARRVLVEMAAAEARRAGRALDRHRRRGHAQGRRTKKVTLRRAHRRPLFQRAARLEQADRAIRSMLPARRSRSRSRTTRSSASRSRARGHRAESVRAGGLRAPT